MYYLKFNDPDELPPSSLSLSLFLCLSFNNISQLQTDADNEVAMR